MNRFRWEMLTQTINAACVSIGVLLLQPPLWQFVFAFSGFVLIISLNRVLRPMHMHRQQISGYRLLNQIMVYSFVFVNLADISHYPQPWMFDALYALMLLWGLWIGWRGASFVLPRRRPEEIWPPETLTRFQIPDAESERKAQTLLREILEPQQLTEYEKYGRISVRLPNGNYARIGYHNVYIPGRIHWPDAVQCVYPRDRMSAYNLPQTDILIGQLLNIRNNPNSVRRIGGLPPL